MHGLLAIGDSISVITYEYSVTEDHYALLDTSGK